MHKDCYFDGEVREEVEIDARSSAALYSKGIFTTIAIYDGQPFVWEKHWRRLTSDAAIVGIDLSGYSEKRVRGALDEIIQHNGVRNGRARITIFDGSPGTIWPADMPRMTSLLIITDDKRPVTDGLRLGISPYPINSRSPLTGLKSCNYLENMLAFEDAGNSGFHEAVRPNEKGEITSACMANIFWLLEERLYTPSLETGCLKGTTREFVLENVECLELKANMEVLDQADAIFLTSAGIGIADVIEINGRKLDAIPAEIKNLIPQKNTKLRE